MVVPGQVRGSRRCIGERYIHTWGSGMAKRICRSHKRRWKDKPNCHPSPTGVLAVRTRQGGAADVGFLRGGRGKEGAEKWMDEGKLVADGQSLLQAVGAKPPAATAGPPRQQTAGRHYRRHPSANGSLSSGSLTHYRTSCNYPRPRYRQCAATSRLLTTMARVHAARSREAAHLSHSVLQHRSIRLDSCRNRARTRTDTTCSFSQEHAQRRCAKTPHDSQDIIGGH